MIDKREYRLIEVGGMALLVPNGHPGQVRFGSFEDTRGDYVCFEQLISPIPPQVAYLLGSELMKAGAEMASLAGAGDMASFAGAGDGD